MLSEKVFLRYLAQTSPHPLKLKVARAKGALVYDQAGKSYFDMISGIAVSNIGHCHPKVVTAVKLQVEKYMHVMAYGEFIQRPQNKLAVKLTALLPPTLNSCYFVNSGAEANEGALKLAKRVTGRTEIVSFKRAYHGSTHGALSVSGNEVKKSAFRPLLPGIRFLDFNVESQLQEISNKTAAVIIEPVQGDAGVRIPTVSFMKKLRQRCNQTGSLLIFDEIQTGFGRTGKLFAFEHFDVVPDILTIAKAFGGGMPIGAFVAKKEQMDVFAYKPMLGHITTFGGHPVNCAAALANLKVITEGNLVSRVEAKGKLLEQSINHPAIREVRRIGLMLAIEFESVDMVQRIVEQCLEKGVITFWFLSCPDSFRLAPPINMPDKALAEAGKLIREAIDICT